VPQRRDLQRVPAVLNGRTTYLLDTRWMAVKANLSLEAHWSRDALPNERPQPAGLRIVSAARLNFRLTGGLEGTNNCLARLL
jgi:hypothetical protein